MMNFKIIRKIFSEASNTYDIVNRILTIGFDQYWRSKAAIHASEYGGDIWLDVCSGTGDMALRLRQAADNKTKILATDFSLSMIELARQKARNKQIEFHIADSLNLPFPDNSIDMVIISFATRNLNISRVILTKFFREFNRVLKPGGRFINLETSQPPSKFIMYIFYTFVRLFVSPIGYLISHSKTAYTYLSYTIRHFYSPYELSDILYESGFKKVSFFRLTFGICAVHTSIK